MAAAADSNRQQEITLLQERSAGTFARVYLAEAHAQDGLSRIVAVKLLKTQWSSDTELLNRTYDEARLLARLHHRNILRVEAIAELSGQPAIIMEFVDGIDLKQIIERTNAPLPPRAVYRVIRDTAAALEAAYFRAPYGRDEPLHVIHRDIKPSNVMISVEGDVKVLDFGTARYQNEIRLAQTGALRFGSLKYMSPERRTGDRGVHSCDIYSLGILLIELMLGELLPILPLDQPDHDEFIQEQINRIGDLGLPNNEWEASLQQTISRMCAFHTGHRLDAQQVVQLMRAFADQANGASLDSYAATTIQHLSDEIFRNKPKGDYSGQRLQISLTSSGNTPKPTTSQQQQQQQQAVAEDTYTDPVQKTDPVPFTPNYTPSDEPSLTPKHHLRANEPKLPDGAEHTFGEINVNGPGPQRPTQDIASISDGEHSSKRPSMLLIGGIAALLGVMLAFLGVGALVMVYMSFFYEPEPDFVLEPSSDPAVVVDDGGQTGPDLENADPGGTDDSPDAATAETVSVTVAAGDERIQWIKVADTDGETLFKAEPGHTAMLPAGEYTLTAKVRLLPKASGTLTVSTEPLTLSCVPDQEQSVVCAIEGQQPITLAP
jgi:serine/threonine protein kinase